MPKVFHHKNGNQCGSTLTVKELRECLSAYPEDMPVMATWEGVVACIEEDMMAVEPIDKGLAVERCEGLLIDVGNY